MNPRDLTFTGSWGIIVPMIEFNEKSSLPDGGDEDYDFIIGETMGPWDSRDEHPSFDNAHGGRRLYTTSIELTVPHGIEVTVEKPVDTETTTYAPDAIHLAFDTGSRIVVSVHGKPRSDDVDVFINQTMRGLEDMGIPASRHEWFHYPMVVADDSLYVAVFVDGGDWILRAAAVMPDHHDKHVTDVLRTVVEDSVIHRGTAPSPPYHPLDTYFIRFGTDPQN